MNLFRRLLGISGDDAAHEGQDQITITRDETGNGMPPEPIIEAPVEAAPAEQTAEHPVPNTEAGANQDEKPGVLAATRQLPPLETIVANPGQRMRFGQHSDVGMVRGNNQDAVFSLVSSGVSNDGLPDFGLFIVADGMGGHQEGERASAVAVRIIGEEVLTTIYMALLKQDMGKSDRPAISDVLREAVEKANDVVADEIPEGGTTATCVVILGDQAYLAHVGDSRAYLITDGAIEQVTRDHSLVQRLIELDQLTPEEAAEHPQRNVLYRAIGQTDNLEVDALTRRLVPRARLLLCSDGLWNMVPEDTLREVALGHDDPQDSCNQLVQLANDRGGPDNITAILIQMPG